MSDIHLMDATESNEATDEATEQHLADAGAEVDPQDAMNEMFESGAVIPVEELEVDGSPLLAAEDAAEREALEANMISIATEQAMQKLFEVQDRLEAAIDDHAEKAEVAKTAKKRVESLQEDLSIATHRLREARTKSEPDPDRFPLFDKEAVNAAFPKPEAIEPLPAEDFAEAYRRLARDTKLSEIGVSGRVVALMEKAGYHTIADIGRLTEASAPLTSVKGIGEKAAEEIIDALGVAADSWKRDWDASHPEDVNEEVADA